MGPFLVSAIARPLYTAPASSASLPSAGVFPALTTMVDGVPPAQPEIVPSSVANRKFAGFPSGPGKVNAPDCENELKTMPVGEAVGTLGSGGAMVPGGMAFSGTFFPL